MLRKQGSQRGNAHRWPGARQSKGAGSLAVAPPRTDRRTAFTRSFAPLARRRGVFSARRDAIRSATEGIDQPDQRFAYIPPGSILQSARADVVRLRAKRRQAACHQVRAVPELPVADRCRRGEATAARPTGPTEESDCRVRSCARRKHRPTWLCPWPYSESEGAAKRAHRVGVRAIWSSG